MTKLLIVFTLAIGVIALVLFMGVPVQSSSYDLKSIDKKPIPKKYFYPLWDQIALKICAEDPKRYNLTEVECQKVIKNKIKSCQPVSLKNAPDLIDNKETARNLGREYLSCITPYYFCNGIEVRTKEEVNESCR
jgi:hypothetical protein